MSELVIDERIVLLAIDDCPGRYDELVGHAGVRLVVTCDDEIATHLLHTGPVDAILLDHDMPEQNGVIWAESIATFFRLPVVVVSTTTTVPDPRPAMVSILQKAGLPVFLCPADHHGCEVEWVAWIRGALAGLKATR